MLVSENSLVTFVGELLRVCVDTVLLCWETRKNGRVTWAYRGTDLHPIPPSTKVIPG